MRKSLIVAAIALIAALPLFATGQKEAASGTQAASQQQINLGVVWWGSKIRHEETIAVLKLYEKDHPNVHFTYQYSGWSDYWTKVTTEAAGGSLPDVMQQDYAYVTQWAHNGLLVNLDPYISSGVIDLQGVKPAYVDGGKVDGHMVAIDLGANTMSFIIDTEAFKKAGIPIPANNWTWNDFENVVMQLHQKLGIWGFSGGLTEPAGHIVQTLFLSLGENTWAANGKSLGFTDPTPFVNYLKMILKLQAAGAIPSESEAISMNNQGPETDPIVKGQAAMTYQWSNQIDAVQSASGPNRHFILHTIPREPGGGPANYIKDGQFFSVTTQSKHQKAAAEFVNWFIHSIPANKIMLGERGVPIIEAVQKAIEPDVTPATAASFEFVNYVAAHAAPTPPPDPTLAANVLNNVFNPQVLQPVMFGKISPEQGAQVFMTQANAILSGQQK